MSAHRGPVAFKTAANRNDRPGPDVTQPDNNISLEQLVADAWAAEKRIIDLHQTHKRTAKALLFENLEQALRIEAAVERGQSVAAFAREAQIEERRAQRLYSLAARCQKIKKEVRDGEAQHGDDYVAPSWKQFLRPAPADQGDDGIGPAKTLTDLYQQLEAAQARIAELETAPPKKREPYGMFARGDPERETPHWLFDHFDREFHFDLDVAATPQNAKCPRFYTKVVNGLVQIWFGNVWLNPPYGEIGLWLKKAWEFVQSGKGIVVALLPIWPTASWFKQYVIHAHIRLLTTRVCFANTVTSAPFDLMIVVLTATSQYRDARLHVSMEDVPDPRKAAKEARAAARKARVAAKTRGGSAAP